MRIGKRVRLENRVGIRPWFRRRPVKIGSARLYCLGPIGLFIYAKEKR